MTRFTAEPCLLYSLHINFYSRLSTQDTTSSSETLERNRIPSCQSPVPASSASSSPLSPKPELADVQKGMTVFPHPSSHLQYQPLAPHSSGFHQHTPGIPGCYHRYNSNPHRYRDQPAPVRTILHLLYQQ